MKIFVAEGSQDTSNKTAEIELVFPAEVDYVALAGFLNDHHICYQFRFEKVSGNVWKAICTRTEEQVRWIPRVSVLGFKKGTNDWC